MSDNRDDRIYKILDKMDQRLDNVDVTLAKQSVVLEEHVKRTNLLESKIADLEADELKPIKKHVDRVNAIMWVMGGLLTVAATLKSLGLF